MMHGYYTVHYHIYLNKRRGAYLIFCATSAVLIWGQCLIEGGAYSSKYSSKEYLASESNLSLATGLASWKVSLEPCLHSLWNRGTRELENGLLRRLVSLVNNNYDHRSTFNRSFCTMYLTFIIHWKAIPLFETQFDHHRSFQYYFKSSGMLQDISLLMKY